jgi:hypothetical protein
MRAAATTARTDHPDKAEATTLLDLGPLPPPILEEIDGRIFVRLELAELLDILDDAKAAVIRHVTGTDIFAGNFRRAVEFAHDAHVRAHPGDYPGGRCPGRCAVHERRGGR